MAFPIERARTALLYGVFFIAMLLAHKWSFIGVWLVILGISLYELKRMLGAGSTRVSIFIAGLLPAALAISHYELNEYFLHPDYVLGLLGLQIILMTVLTIDFIFFAKSQWMRHIPNLIALLYVGNSIALLIIMRSTYEHGAYLVLCLLILIWAADVGAYFSGKKFGKNKLIPLVSPNKTWEGLIGGIIISIITAIILKVITGVGTIGQWIIMALIVSLAGVAGDLIESKIKRLSNVKDSGNILPGHGGLLDRFDALFGFIPFAFLYLWWLNIIYV